jgi:hypothetical protein
MVAPVTTGDLTGRSICRPRNDLTMFLVTIVCSDPNCLEEREIAVSELDAVDAQACDCGHGFVLMSVSSAAA